MLEELFISSSDEYFAVIKTGNECQLQGYMLLPSELVVNVGWTKVLFQVSPCVV